MQANPSLLEYFHKDKPQSRIVDRSSLRYAVYVRKSTDDTAKQVRSIQDQIDECLKYAQNNGLKIDPKHDIFREEGSAKISGTRPVFRQLIADIEQSKYDGILAWAPDRLSRNMREAGMIIDLLDTGVIKDLQFSSFTFENDHSGKMMLGIHFVLAKEYSDKLSKDIHRGNRKSIQEGRYIGRVIHGYAKDEEQFLRPDVGNYDIIQKAWRMRINGSRGKEIAEYINDAGYRACTGHGQNKKHKAKVFNEKTVMEIFREPVYAGVLKFGEHEAVDLCGVYDFTPMITEQEFIEVNNIDLLTPQSRAKRGINKNEFQRKNFLHDVVICDHCDRRMGFHVTNKANGELRGYFVCQRSDCPYWRLKLQSKHNRVRGKVIRDKALEIIESLNYHSKSAYEQFSKEYVSTRLLETKRLKDEIKALQLQKTQLEKQISDHQAVLIDQTISKKQEAVNAFEDAIKKTREQLDVVETSIIEKQESLDALKSSVPSMDRFIELLDTWAVKITQKISLEELDFFLSKLLLNCRIKSGNVASYQLHPPFSSLTKMKDFASGGPEQN